MKEAITPREGGRLSCQWRLGVTRAIGSLGERWVVGRTPKRVGDWAGNWAGLAGLGFEKGVMAGGGGGTCDALRFAFLCPLPLPICCYSRIASEKSGYGV